MIFFFFKYRKNSEKKPGFYIVFSDFERGFIAARSSSDWSQHGFIVGGGLRTEHGFISGFLRYVGFAKYQDAFGSVRIDKKRRYLKFCIAWIYRTKIRLVRG
jgi:hypothetical protein